MWVIDSFKKLANQYAAIIILLSKMLEELLKIIWIAKYLVRAYYFIQHSIQVLKYFHIFVSTFFSVILKNK